MCMCDWFLMFSTLNVPITMHWSPCSVICDLFETCSVLKKKVILLGQSQGTGFWSYIARCVEVLGFWRHCVVSHISG